MFTHDETSLLFEALDALEKKASGDELMSLMITSMVAQGDERDKALEESKKNFEILEREQAPLKERIIMLKAKLISMRDRAFIDELSLDSVPE